MEEEKEIVKGEEKNTEKGSVPEEGKVTEEGNVADTSAAPETSAPVPELDNEVKPTEEEIVDAGLENENAPVVEGEKEIVPAPEKPEKTFTQEEVNELVGKTRVDTRNKTFEYIYGRYGVKDEAGLDDLIGNAQRYDSLREEYDGEKAHWKEEADNRSKEFSELKEKVALMESGIDSDRYDDAKFILKGKGLEVTAENIANELNSHPEWKKADKKVFTPKETVSSKISVLGNEKIGPEHSDNEEEIAMGKYFKV